MLNYHPRSPWSEEDIQNLVKNSEVYPTYSTINHLVNRHSNSTEFAIDTEDSILQRLPFAVSKLWESVGLKLDYEYNQDLTLEQLNLVLCYIRKIDPNSFYQSVEILVKSVHILESKDAFTDVSYTDPDLPFTVFINIPNYKCKNWLERAVENIIHETMHLQLSLLEDKYDLYLDSNRKTYSPWKDAFRDSKGLLHALYVFANLQHFWQEVYNKRKCSFAARRIEEIESEKNLIDYELIKSLYTQKGVQLLGSCLAKNTMFLNLL